MATSTKRKATKRERTRLHTTSTTSVAGESTEAQASSARRQFTLAPKEKEPAEVAESQRQKERAPRRTLRERADGVTDTARRHPRALLVLAAMVMVVAMLYGPLRDYYVARRTGEDLQAYYEAVEAQNGELSEDIRQLQTREGVEDEARERGLVYPDETSVVVEGLTGTVDTPLPEVTLEDTRPWYIRVLDIVFGYEFGTWQ